MAMDNDEWWWFDFWAYVILLAPWWGGTVGFLFSTKFQCLNFILSLLFFLLYAPAFFWICENGGGIWSKLVRLFARCRARAELKERFIFLYRYVTGVPEMEPFDIPPTETTLRVDSNYLRHYFQLSRRQAQYVARTLQHAHIDHVTLDLSFVEAHNMKGWHLLCQGLGSNSSIQRMYILTISDNDRGSSSQQLAVGALQTICNASSLLLHSSTGRGTDWNFSALAHGLRQQQRLESLEYSLPVTTYRDILPAVQSLALKSLTLTVPSDQSIDALTAKALSQFLAWCSVDCIQLNRLQFVDSQAWNLFCSGVSQCSTKSLHFSSLALQDTAALGAALESSSCCLRHLILSSAPDGGSNLSNFLPALASSLPLTSFLLTLDLERLAGFRGDPLIESELISVIRAAAMCSTLVTLKLPDVQYSEAMDNALADLLQSEKSSLETLTMMHLMVSLEENRVSFPGVLDALQSNVTIMCIELRTSLPRFLHMHCDLPYWSDAFQQQIAIVTRLNKHGRAYLLDDPCNTAKGVKLLEAAIDDLPCLYFHLREHPALCCQTSQSLRRQHQDAAIGK